LLSLVALSGVPVLNVPPAPIAGIVPFRFPRRLRRRPEWCSRTMLV
jgi:hypothetical protein